jgi:hypothetical protein
MNETDKLIDQLAASARPVRQLSSPGRRTLIWMLISMAIMTVLVLVMGSRPGLSAITATPSATLEWAAGLLTGVLAAYAAFQISVPGRSPSWAWLPLPSAIIWLAGIGLGCLQNFSAQGAGAFAMEAQSSECALAITMTSLPLGLALLLMVRHAGVVRPGPTALLRALGAAAISAAGVSLIHQGENALMVLLWHGGAVVLLSILSWLFGRQLFSWVGYARQ